MDMATTIIITNIQIIIQFHNLCINLVIWYKIYLIIITIIMAIMVVIIVVVVVIYLVRIMIMMILINIWTLNIIGKNTVHSLTLIHLILTNIKYKRINIKWNRNNRNNQLSSLFAKIIEITMHHYLLLEILIIVQLEIIVQLGIIWVDILVIIGRHCLQIRKWKIWWGMAILVWGILCFNKEIMGWSILHQRLWTIIVLTLWIIEWEMMMISWSIEEACSVIIVE